MVTMVGMQSEFKDAMISLLELEYDALAAYELAVEKLEDKNYKQQMKEFMGDHKNHIQEIEKLLIMHNIEFESGPSAKQILTKGKVIMAELMGDKAILLAMLTNEMDTNSAYDRMTARKDDWKDTHAILKANLEDEKRHRDWIQQTLLDFK